MRRALNIDFFSPSLTDVVREFILLMRISLMYCSRNWYHCTPKPLGTPETYVSHISPTVVGTMWTQCGHNMGEVGWSPKEANHCPNQWASMAKVGRMGGGVPAHTHWHTTMCTQYAHNVHIK